jgi:O-antigen/teichoic acid export membrane protein
MVFAHDAADEDNARLAKIARISSVVCAAFAAAICAAAPWVFPLVFGSGFSEAVPSTAILLLAIVCGVPGSVAGSALAARGHVGLRSWGLLVALMVNVVLLVWLAPRFGAVGAAAATLGANFVATVWALIFLRRREAVAIRTFIGVRRGDIELIWTKVDGRLRAARARDPQGGERE